VFSDFKTFLKSVRDRLADTRIIFLSIKPSPKRWKLKSQQDDVNSRIKDLSRDDGLLTYVETAPTIVGDDGQPRINVFRDDGLHLNEKGYAGWNRILENHLQSISQRK
jgi:lysophospholipase L1-like esterase